MEELVSQTIFYEISIHFYLAHFEPKRFLCNSLSLSSLSLKTADKIIR